MLEASQRDVVSVKAALPVRIGASLLAAVMQALAGFALGFTSLVLLATGNDNASFEWWDWLVLAGSASVVLACAAAAMWLQRRSRLITWPIWPIFVVAGFLGFFVLLVLTATGD
jgi:uncharacterized membrane protein YfcA